MKTILSIFLLLGLTSYSGCNRKEANSVQPTDQSNIVGKWLLSDPRTEFTITLDIAHKSTQGTTSIYQISGLSPVNQYGAEATIQASGTISVGSISATKRGGEPAAMTAETNYFNSLKLVDKIELVSGKLQLRSRDTRWPLLAYDKQ